LHADNTPNGTAITIARVWALDISPNVGKSRLFNRLARKRISIVHDQPGITRDVISAEIEEGKYTLLDTGGLGYEGGALVFGAGLAVVVALYFWTNLSRVAIFWAAFILTRPLGATVGDFLDKPLADGGLALSRYAASAALAAVMVLLILALPQRAERQPA